MVMNSPKINHPFLGKIVSKRLMRLCFIIPPVSCVFVVMIPVGVLFFRVDWVKRFHWDKTLLSLYLTHLNDWFSTHTNPIIRGTRHFENQQLPSVLVLFYFKSPQKSDNKKLCHKDTV